MEVHLIRISDHSPASAYWRSMKHDGFCAPRFFFIERYRFVANTKKRSASAFGAVPRCYAQLSIGR